MGLGRWVFLNGEFVQADAAAQSPFDRGFLFAHAAYEVTALYNSRFIDIDRHLKRLSRTLNAIEIAVPDDDIESLHHEVIARNELDEGLVYLQVSAGNQGPRDFYGPEILRPSIFVFSTERQLISDVAQTGVKAITKEDTRWKRCDVKTTQLLSQSLAYREARRRGAYTALMHEDGVVTEAASANAWIVDQDGAIITRDLSPSLLPGVTRDRVLSLLTDEGYVVQERAFTVEEAKSASECFTTSTGVTILPITSLDGHAVGKGLPGPITRTAQRLYYQYMGANIALAAPWAKAN
ncbi:MAG: aminotransferase class IV [Pseudomonadota bacterium]